MMRNMYINPKLNPLIKFTSSCRSTGFKDIFSSNISQIITKTIPISMRIVIRYNETGYPVLWQQYDQTVCPYQVTYVFQSKSTHCSSLNVKELLARSRHEIWSLSDCNWTHTRNHLVHRQTLNHLAKLAILINEIIELCCEYLSVQCIWLYILIMSRMHFRVNPHSIVAWISRNSLLEAGAKSEV